MHALRKLAVSSKGNMDLDDLVVDDDSEKRPTDRRSKSPQLMQKQGEESV